MDEVRCQDVIVHSDMDQSSFGGELKLWHFLERELVIQQEK